MVFVWARKNRSLSLSLSLSLPLFLFLSLSLSLSFSLFLSLSLSLSLSLPFLTLIILYSEMACFCTDPKEKKMIPLKKIAQELWHSAFFLFSRFVLMHCYGYAPYCRNLLVTQKATDIVSFKTIQCKAKGV